MELILNKLPSKTWNRLGMNDVRVSLEEGFTNKIPTASYDEKEVKWAENIDESSLNLDCKTHRELAEIVEGASLSLAETYENVKMEKPVILTYSYKDGEKGKSRLILKALKNSLLKVILIFKDEGACESAFEAEVYAEEGSRVEIYTAELLGNTSIALHNIGGICKDNAHIEAVKLELGGRKVVSGMTVDLTGDGSSFTSDTGYHAKADQLIDMNYVANHRGKNTEAFMEAAGTLEEKSKKVYRGSIDFKKGCAGSKGTENENVLLLGDKLTNQTIPLILCAEEDVEGNHGASIGRLDDKILFYLGTRGINEDEAQNMIALSRIKSIWNRIPDENIVSEIEDFENMRGISYVPKI